MTTIQRYHSSDKKSVLALWKLCDMARSNEQCLYDIESCITASSSELFVGHADKMLVGTAMVGCNWAAGWVYYLAVHPEWRLNGIGRLLMNRSEVWVKEQGPVKIWVEISPSRLIARGFYRCLGFADTNSFVMQKLLK